MAFVLSLIKTVYPSRGLDSHILIGHFRTGEVSGGPGKFLNRKRLSYTGVGKRYAD